MLSGGMPWTIRATMPTDLLNQEEPTLTTTSPAAHNNLQLLAAARSGDETAFAELTQPLQREIHIHCYRMLGTLHDADDALQETLLRAWRQLDRFEPRAPLRAWLYRIATNVCLTFLERRSRRSEVPLTALDGVLAAAPVQGGEPMPLQPYPDHLLRPAATLATNPELQAEQNENVALAFIAAVQLLPARQRAAFLLREVIGYSAAEVARMLHTSVASVNSALQRARSTIALGQTTGTIARAHISPGADTEQALVQRLIDAWESADVGAIVDILSEDALFSMPPLPYHYVGRDAIARFLTTVPARGRLDHFRLIPIRANHQPAVAAYWRKDGTGPYTAHAIIVVAFTRGKIASLTRFDELTLFSCFGLPLALA